MTETSTDLAVRDEKPAAAVLTNDQLAYIARTEFVPTGLRGNLPAILACVATGRALGLPDMTALRSIHIIDGKATFSAELMVQLVRRRGHSITGEVGEGKATVTGRRVDNGDTMTSTWTLAMAERAGLANKQNWKRYPEAMLWARAVSQLCRMLFADCFAGATYTTEELGAEQTDAAGIPAGDGPITTDVEDDGLFPPLEPEVVEPDTPRMASAAQRTLLWTVTRGAGVPEEHLRALVEQTTGQRSTKEIPAARFEEILAGAERLAAVAELDGATKLLLAHADETGNRAEVEAAIAANRDRHGADVVSHVGWLKAQIARAEAAKSREGVE